MSEFELTGKGRYYHVYVDGVETTKHTTEREAIEKAYAQAKANPDAKVKYVHKYEVDVALILAGGGPPAGGPESEEVLAFPGAVGYGKDATGGRGGHVYHVTTLSPTGAGSISEAVSSSSTPSGPRTVVFDVSGIITLTGSGFLAVQRDDLTIAGQTSPGGILIRGRPTRVEGRNVIVRHVGFRAGYDGYIAGGGGSSYDALFIAGVQWGGNTGAGGVILDHVTAAWANDGQLEVTGGVPNVTIMRSLIHEGMGGAPRPNHGYGSLFAMDALDPSYTDQNITLYRNFWCHLDGRTPRISLQNGTMLTDYINNVSYNSNSGFTPRLEHSGTDLKVNWIHNYRKDGPYNPASRGNRSVSIEYHTTDVAEFLYMEGNLSDQRTSQGASQWDAQENFTSTLASTAYQAGSAFTVPYTLTPATMSLAEAQSIADEAGVTVPVQNSRDAQAAVDFAAVGGQSVSLDGPTNCTNSDYPTFSTPSIPTGADGADGIPDAYKTANGLTIGVDYSGVASSNGYDWPERYINDLADGNWTN